MCDSESKSVIRKNIYHSIWAERRAGRRAIYPKNKWKTITHIYYSLPLTAMKSSIRNSKLTYTDLCVCVKMNWKFNCIRTHTHTQDSNRLYQTKYYIIIANYQNIDQQIISLFISINWRAHTYNHLYESNIQQQSHMLFVWRRKTP